MAAPYTEFETHVRQGGAAAIREAGAFFMGEDPVHRALHAIAERLESLHVPYAIAGGMALVAHGFERTTTDVDVLVTPEGLIAVHQQLEGLGYVPPFAGSKQLRDINTKVRIEFLVTGQFPGDGKPKPLAFPDPAKVSVNIDGIQYLRLPTLIELKLASGISGGVPRLKDFADVVSLITILNLPLAFVEQISPYVRDKFTELWNGIAAAPDRHAD